jgi:hypothetical protein
MGMGGMGGMGGDPSASSATPSTDNALFQQWVDEKFQSYVGKMSSTFLARCLDEVLPTRLLSWNMQLYSAPGDLEPTGTGGVNVEHVRRLSLMIFENAKQRITGNVLLKCYNLFLDQTQIWGEIQAEINMGLTETLLEELFEVQATTRRLRAAEERFGKERESLAKQEATLAQAVQTLGAK